MNYQATAATTRRHRGMKRLIGMAVAVSASLLISGAAAEMAWADPAPPSGQSATSTGRTSDSDAAFLQVVRQRPVFARTDDNTLISMGHLVCRALDSGVTVQQLAAEASPTVSPYDAGWLLGSSVVVYCPAHSGLLIGLSSMGGNSTTSA
jgi:Protein of unknown function (DUF732)